MRWQQLFFNVHIFIKHINSSIIQGDFPEKLKLAKVISIYKADNEQHIQNYRPISVLPFFSKIFEKVIYNKLLEFINANNILYVKQFGFCQGHATSHAIMTLVEKVTKALDTGKIVVGVYLDIRKDSTVSQQVFFWTNFI